MTDKKTAKPEQWPTHIVFDWQKDRLRFSVIDFSKRGKDKILYTGWALEGSLEIVAERVQEGHSTIMYALVTPAQLRQWGKTRKPPKGYPF